VVEYNVIQYVDVGMRAQQIRHLAGAGTAALDHRANTAAAKMPERRMHGESASAPGEFRRPLEGIAFLVGLNEVRRGYGHGRAMRLRMRADDQAGVVRDVEPFVAVGGPGIGTVNAGDQVFELIAHACPESESAINMQPCAG